MCTAVPETPHTLHYGRVHVQLLLLFHFLLDRRLPHSFFHPPPHFLNVHTGLVGLRQIQPPRRGCFTTSRGIHRGINQLLCVLLCFPLRAQHRRLKEEEEEEADDGDIDKEYIEKEYTLTKNHYPRQGSKREKMRVKTQSHLIPMHIELAQFYLPVPLFQSWPPLFPPRWPPLSTSQWKMSGCCEGTREQKSD